MTSKIVLDECVPRRLRRAFPAGMAFHVRDLGWQGLKNGRLLAAMREESFEVLVTVDKNLSFQQNVGVSGIAVIVIHAVSNRPEDLLLFVPEVLSILETVELGTVRHLGEIKRSAKPSATGKAE